MFILGIETSCDDTAVAIIDDKYTIKANIISSQIKIHTKYGGVVPELASREHVKNIVHVFNECFSQSNLALKDIEAIAVTKGPGLVISLLVAINFAKALSMNISKPLISVNHLYAHLNAVFLEHKEIPLPYLGLVASGGHTNLFYTNDNINFISIAKTRDDAIGEAYDKIAKLLDLGYPGGPIIDKLAKNTKTNLINLPKAKMSDNSLDFSFSGLKTAVYYFLKKEQLLPFPKENTSLLTEIASSFQRAAVSIVIDRLYKAITIYKPKSLIISGGVACNSLLRKEAAELAGKFSIPVFIPQPILCTDNAAMTAVIGLHKYQLKLFEDLSMDAEPIYYDY
jgi:N6-L-threonylcarbamoyladenine synthase